MADARTDREILQGGTVTVSLCGKSYEFREPGRRQAVAMLREVLEIQPLMMDSASQSQKMDGVYKCLDWLYRWHPEMKRDKLAIDDNAELDEISLAFAAVVEMVNRPFVQRAAKAHTDQHEDAPTDTPNPAP